MPFPQSLIKQWGAELKWVCQDCGRKWKDGFLLEGHHKIPTHCGGKDVKDNFRLLCQECHIKAHEFLAQKDRTSAELIRNRFKRTKGRWR